MKPNKYHPPCRRCGLRHSPFEPCFDWRGDEEATTGMMKIILIGFGILWGASSIVAIIWKIYNRQP